MSEILTSPRPSRFGRAVGFRLAGVGSYAPPTVVTNADLARLGCDPEWIVERSGIHERRHASPEMATSDLAAEAGRAAIAQAGVAPADVDLVVLGTFTPDMCIPSTACIVQEKLGLDAAAMDVTAACAGFAYALVTAAQFVVAGSSRLPLVIGADTNSRVVDPDDIKTWPLFGDGAGAALLEPVEPEPSGREHGLLAFSLGSDGRGAGLLQCPMSGSRQPVTVAGADRVQVGDPARRGEHPPGRRAVRDVARRHRSFYFAPGQRPDHRGRADSPRRRCRPLHGES
jgi:3-oxoacyl-[acyl-carrier-protein] synthase-3